MAKQSAAAENQQNHPTCRPSFSPLLIHGSPEPNNPLLWVPPLHLHLADAFIQSDLQGCVHILHLH